MIYVTLYSRDDCSLCEKAIKDLESIQDIIPHRLSVVDIDQDRKLKREYGNEVPVVEVGPYKLRAPFTIEELQVTLAAAKDRERHIALVESSEKLDAVRKGAAWTFADRISFWISRNYLTVLNSLVLLYLGMSFLAPGLLIIRAEIPANWIYKSYGLVCHQLSYRSIFILGEQFFYPRKAANVEGLKTYNEATGLSEASTAKDLFKARAYNGDDHIGFKVALCQRDLAIYGGILIFGLLFGLTGRRIPGVPWYLWIVVGIIPIAMDGVSQLLSQPPFNFFPFRESTPSLRIFTGFLFGFFTAWFGYPLVEESMADTRKIMGEKRRRSKDLIDNS